MSNTDNLRRINILLKYPSLSNEGIKRKRKMTVMKNGVDICNPFKIIDMHLLKLSN